MAGPPGPQGPRGEPGPRGLPGSTGLSPELMARIARLEEFAASARLQGALSTIPAAHTSTMTHVAELGSHIAETSRPSDTGRTFETGRTTDAGRATVETSRPLETDRPAEIGRTMEAGRRTESRPEAGAGRTTVASMASGQPTDTVRPTMERSRIVDNRRTPDGSSRRDDPYRRSDDVDPVVFRAAEDRRTNGTSYGWLWALPLAALAGLGLYFLRPSEQGPVTASRDTVQTVAALPDPKTPTLNAIQSLTAAVQGITDRATATAALPKIQDAGKDMDRLAMQSVQLPNDARTALASATREPMTKLNTLLDTASNLPGVGPMLQPAIASLRNRMDAIAMAPGKPLFMASAPTEWVTLSSFYDRDVLNSAGEKVGTASGFFIGPDRKITASLVSVDRQLGIGDKQVAMPFAGGQLVRRGDGWHLVVNASKDDLQRAKAFETTR